MELVQQGKDVCTLRNDDTTAYHVAITGDVNEDINVLELLPGQHVQFDLTPPVSFIAQLKNIIRISPAARTRFRQNRQNAHSACGRECASRCLLTPGGPSGSEDQVREAGPDEVAVCVKLRERELPHARSSRWLLDGYDAGWENQRQSRCLATR